MKNGVASIHRLTISSKTMWDFFFDFQNLLTNVSNFSRSNDFLAPVMLIFYVYSSGYPCIRNNKTIFPNFFRESHHNYYKNDMKILLLKSIGCNYSKDAPLFVFPYLQHFLSYNHATKWTYKFDSRCRSNIFNYLFLCL